MIRPTIGRIVQYYADGAMGTEPQAAIVAYVHDAGFVNLSVINHSGFSQGKTNVYLRDPQEDRPADGAWCEWPEVKKTAGSESGEVKEDEKIPGYRTWLQSMPEPLRAQLLRGDFQTGVEDNTEPN